MSFENLGLCDPVLRAIAEEGYQVATPIQLKAIPAVVAGSDVLGLAQTGTGKTAAFALPILHRLSSGEQDRSGVKRPIRALVLASTRELALQIAERFSVYGRRAALRTAVVHGGVNQDRQVRQLSKGVDILVATPGRLLDLFAQNHLHLRHVQILVLDEADRMLDMGFLPAIRKIVAHVPAKRQTLLFSATMPAAVSGLAESILRDPRRIAVEPDRQTTELVAQQLCMVPSKQAKTEVLLSIVREANAVRTLVFARTKRGADRLAQGLERSGISTAAIHGNKSQNQRTRILEAFRTGQVPVLIATDVAARGIDVDAISHVVNFDVPHEPETYIHRIGRTGRAGATGVAITLCDPEERSLVRDIEKLLGTSIPRSEFAGSREEKSRSAPATNSQQRQLSPTNAPKPRPTRFGPAVRSGKPGPRKPIGGHRSGQRRVSVFK